MLSSADFQRIAAVLAQFDCNARDAEVFVQSLQSGPASVQQLARVLGENRVTVYSAAERLIEKGLLYETRRGKRRMVVAEEPDVLKRLLQRRKNELDLLADNVDRVAALLASLRTTDGGVPSVKFYEGVEGLKKMLEETLAATNEVLVFTYVDLFSSLLSPRYLENYYVRRAKKGIATRLIFPDAAFGKRVAGYAAKYAMQVRFLRPDLAWKSGIFAWNDTIAIQSFTEGKVTCTIIENPDIAHFYRTIIYEMCWAQARPL